MEMPGLRCNPRRPCSRAWPVGDSLAPERTVRRVPACFWRCCSLGFGRTQNRAPTGKFCLERAILVGIHGRCLRIWAGPQCGLISRTGWVLPSRDGFRLARKPEAAILQVRYAQSWNRRTAKRG